MKVLSEVVSGQMVVSIGRSLKSSKSIKKLINEQAKRRKEMIKIKILYDGATISKRISDDRKTLKEFVYENIECITGNKICPSCFIDMMESSEDGNHIKTYGCSYIDIKIVETYV